MRLGSLLRLAALIASGNAAVEPARGSERSRCRV